MPATVLHWYIRAKGWRSHPRKGNDPASIQNQSPPTDLKHPRALSASGACIRPSHPHVPPQHLQSQPLSLSYGSHLPTSLTYFVLESRGCSPRSPDADIGTVTPYNGTARTSTSFSWASDPHRTAESPTALESHQSSNVGLSDSRDQQTP